MLANPHHDALDRIANGEFATEVRPAQQVEALRLIARRALAAPVAQPEMASLLRRSLAETIRAAETTGIADSDPPWYQRANKLLKRFKPSHRKRQ